MLPSDHRRPSAESAPALDSSAWEPDFKVDWEAHLEALPCATWIGNPTGGSVFINQAYRRILGVHSLDEVQGDRWNKHIHPDDRNSYVKAWERFMHGLSSRFKESVRWVRPDTGQTTRIVVRAQKLLCGQLQGWIRTAAAEQALAKLEKLTYVRR